MRLTAKMRSPGMLFLGCCCSQGGGTIGSEICFLELLNLHPVVRITAVEVEEWWIMERENLTTFKVV